MNMPLPKTMDELRAYIAAGAFNPTAQIAPAPAPAAHTMPIPLPTSQPAPAITIEQINELIDKRVAERMASARYAGMPAEINAIAQFDQIFERALSPDDLSAFKQYVAAGSPGFDKLMVGDKLYPVVQALWKTIRDSEK
ncbi:MAG: hypothetical protein JO253_07975 [Alphaproteobacteria bacterium]|nr:hypothetical protein [Alphaproteobacteria bacterium]